MMRQEVPFNEGDRVRDKFRRPRPTVGEGPEAAFGTIKSIATDGPSAIKIAWDRGGVSEWGAAQCNALLELIDQPKELKGGERVKLMTVDYLKMGPRRHFENTGNVLCVEHRSYKLRALVQFDGDDDPWWVNVQRLKVVKA